MIICTDISIVVEDIMHGLQVEALFNLSERAHSQVYSGNSKSYTVHGGAFWNEISKTFISFITKKIKYLHYLLSTFVQKQQYLDRGFDHNLCTGT